MIDVMVGVPLQSFVALRPMAGDFTDPANARIIYLAALALVGAAGLLLVATIWWWKSSRVEHPVLGPLEIMGGRRWGNATYGERQLQLDGVRPVGAFAFDDAARPLEQVELVSFDRSGSGAYDDLRELPGDDFGAAIGHPVNSSLAVLLEPFESDVGHRPDEPFESDIDHRPDEPFESDIDHRTDSPFESDIDHRTDSPFESDIDHRASEPSSSPPPSPPSPHESAVAMDDGDVPPVELTSAPRRTVEIDTSKSSGRFDASIDSSPADEVAGSSPSHLAVSLDPLLRPSS